MAYGTLKSDVMQSSTAGTPPQFKDGNGTQVGTLCRAWVNFNGNSGSVAINASFNVSSVTRNGTGDYTVTFTNAMPDANYAWSYGSQYSNSGAASRQNIFPMMLDGAGLVATSSLRFYTGTTVGTFDSTIVTAQIFR